MFTQGESRLIRFLSNPSLSRAALLAAMLLIPMFLLVPQAVLAQAVNCPPEPTQATIASGDVYIGPNCTLNTSGDVDSFVFSGNAGDVWYLAAGLNGGSTIHNICLALHDPNFKSIYSNCTTVGGTNWYGFEATVTLTTGGQSNIDMTETSSGAQSYALGLERIYPLPPNAQASQLLVSYPGDLAEITDSNAFVFDANTTGEYQVYVGLSGTVTSNVCLTVYSPTGTLITPTSGSEWGCTTVGGTNWYFVQIDFVPPENGRYLAFITGYHGVSAQTYNLEISCVAGTCPNKVPTTTTLTSSPNPSADGQSVTFTAVVSSSEGAPPNGETVSFMNGKTVLGTGTLSNGTATFPDSKLTPGATTSVTAVYPGDANFMASTSNVVKQVVSGPCTLTDSLRYSVSSKTLTMKFTIGNTVATTWNIWLTDQNTMAELFSASQPITTPPVSITKTTPSSAEGKVGVLSTLTTPTNGIVCSSWVLINTGTP
jgi:hypothetical protein